MRLFKPSRLPSPSVIERHHHTRPYATVVLSGSYEESGDAGRFRVEAGDVLLHGSFSAHNDRISKAGATVLDLPLPFDAERRAGRARIADPDHLVRLSESDGSAAIAYFLDTLHPCCAAERDLPDMLADALRGIESPAIGEWAASVDRTREHLSREFSKLYGVSAARYRSEARARNAWHALVRTEASLAAIAADTGHADQAHMARAIRSLTGATPTDWRRWEGARSAKVV